MKFPRRDETSTIFEAAFSIDTAGIGRVNVPVPANRYSTQPPCKGFASHFLFYLTGSGGPALAISYGNVNYPFIGAGIAYPQTASPTFPNDSGMYAFSFTQQNGSQFDGTGQMTAYLPEHCPVLRTWRLREPP